MRLLLMHVDYFEYKTTKATKYAEDLDGLRNEATKRVLLYPYAHLSSELASPEIALAILQQIESLLVGYEVLRAPFGWYKSFSLKCKGHPLAELSRSIKVEAQPEKKKVDRDFYVMEPDGKLTPANAYSSADSEFQDILRYE